MEFRQTPGGRSLLLLGYLLSKKAMKMVCFGVVRPEMTMQFGSKEVGPKA